MQKAHYISFLFYQGVLFTGTYKFPLNLHLGVHTQTPPFQPPPQVQDLVPLNFLLVGDDEVVVKENNDIINLSIVMYNHFIILLMPYSV